jgi:PBP1b-binding outer membrane lipoprotein LpoB
MKSILSVLAISSLLVACSTSEEPVAEETVDTTVVEADSVIVDDTTEVAEEVSL